MLCSAVVEGRAVNAAVEGETDVKITGIELRLPDTHKQKMMMNKNAFK